MKYYGTNSLGQSVYYYDVPGLTVGILFNGYDENYSVVDYSLKTVNIEGDTFKGHGYGYYCTTADYQGMWNVESYKAEIHDATTTAVTEPETRDEAVTDPEEIITVPSTSDEIVTDPEEIETYPSTSDEVTTDPVEKPTILAYDKQKYHHIAGDMTNWQKASYDDEISFYLEAGTYEFSIYYIIHASYGPYGSSFKIQDDIHSLALTTSPDRVCMTTPVDGVYTTSHSFDSGVVYLNVTYPENAPDAPEYVEFDYTVNTETNEATITDYLGTAKVVEVPQYIDGYPVTAIGSSAFYATFVEKVILPEGLKTIGRSAFGHCTDLVEVCVPDSVTDIGASAFFYCPKLTGFDFPARITVINESTF